jgi:hypothetical protein
MADLLFIPRGMIADAWPNVGPMLQRAIKRSGPFYDLGDVRRKLEDGDISLWAVMHEGRLTAAFTTNEIIYPRRKIMLVELLGGKDANLWYHDTVEKLAEIARETGYDAIETVARRGWAKMAGKVGFKETAVTYEMEL